MQLLFIAYLEPRVCYNFIIFFFLQVLTGGISQPWRIPPLGAKANSGTKLRWINWNPTGSMLEISSVTIPLQKKTQPCNN